MNIQDRFCFIVFVSLVACTPALTETQSSGVTEQVASSVSTGCDWYAVDATQLYCLPRPTTWNGAEHQIYFADDACSGTPLHGGDTKDVPKYLTNVRFDYAADPQYLFFRTLNGFATIHSVGEEIPKPTKIYMKQVVMDGWTGELETRCDGVPSGVVNALFTTAPADLTAFPRGTFQWEGREDDRLLRPVVKNEAGDIRDLTSSPRGVILFDRFAGAQCSLDVYNAHKGDLETFALTMGRCWLNSSSEIGRTDDPDFLSGRVFFDSACTSTEPKYLREPPHHPGASVRFAQKWNETSLHRVNLVNPARETYLKKDSGKCVAYGPMEEYEVSETFDEAPVQIVERGAGTLTSGYVQVGDAFLFAGFVDAETHDRCFVYQDQSGTKRCLPPSLSSFGFWGSGMWGSATYLDAACSQPAGQRYRGLPWYGKVVAKRGKETFIYRVGAVVSPKPSKLYTFDSSGACVVSIDYHPDSPDEVRAFTSEEPITSAPELPSAPAPFVP